VWWDDTPIDVFLDLHPFHAEIAAHTRIVPFEGREIPVLRCTDLAVFKALLDRTRDWADIEEMITAGTLDVPASSPGCGRSRARARRESPDFRISPGRAPSPPDT